MKSFLPDYSASRAPRCHPAAQIILLSVPLIALYLSGQRG